MSKNHVEQFRKMLKNTDFAWTKKSRSALLQAFHFQLASLSG